MKPEEYLKKAQEAVNKALAEKKMAKELIASLGPAIIETLEPILTLMATNSKTTKEEFLDAISNIKIEVPEIVTPKAEVTVSMPEIKVPQAEVTVKNEPISTKGIEIAIKDAFKTVKLPTPTLNVSVPDIKIPEIKIPAPNVSFPDKINALLEYDYNRPLPVLMMDTNGKPFQFSFGVGGGGGGGGGKADHFTIKDIRASTVSIIDQDSGALKVTGNFSVTSSASSTLAQLVDSDGNGYSSANPLQIAGSISTTPGATFYASDAIGSTNTIQLGGNDIALGEGVVNAGTQRVVHVADVAHSTNVVQFGGVAVKISQGDGASATGMLNGLPMAVNASGSHDRLRNFAGEGAALRVQMATDAVGSMYVTGAAASTYAEIMNPDGRVKVELPTGSSGLTDTELRATAVPVAQVSGASWSTSATIQGTPTVSVTDVFGTVGTNVVNPDGRLKVELPTGSSGLTDTELRATAVPVSQVSGANFSVFVTDIFGSTVTSDVINSDNRIRVSVETGGSGLTDAELRASAVPVSQVSGANFSVEVTNTVTVTGSLTSTVSVGDTVSDAADSGSAPVKVGGIARTTNPTAVADGDRVSATFDDVGRMITRPINARDLIKTAYATLTNGTETTLLAGSANVFYDLIHVMGSNSSDQAVIIDVRDGTAGGVIASFTAPASNMGGFSTRVPIPQGVAGSTWTLDMPDITGTTVYVTGLFSTEV